MVTRLEVNLNMTMTLIGFYRIKVKASLKIKVIISQFKDKKIKRFNKAKIIIIIRTQNYYF